MAQQRWLSTLACGVLACCVTLSMNNPLARGADAPAAKETKEKDAKEKGKSRGRLPPFYSKVVDKEQRAAIYKVQEQYSPQIEELAKQLEAIEDKRDAEIAALLTEEQRQKVAALIAEAKAKGAEAKKKPAAPTSSTAAAPEGK
jgi:hypothetical protein